ncbi:MAG: SIS domain-containing protein [Nocardioidaceae bacterium]
MRREIAEQPRAVAATLEAGLPLRQSLRHSALDRRHVLLVARGSSDNAAIYARYLLEVHSRRQTSLAAPSIATAYGTALDLSDTLVVSVSQSGATEEIVHTQEWARRCGAATVAVTNDPDSDLAGRADHAIVTMAGTERAVPATKTYTTQLAALAVLATALAPDLHALDQELGMVPAQIQRLVDRTDVGPVSIALGEAAEVLVTGRGLVYGTALELALKMEETCLRPVRGLSYADLRHGPMAVVDDQSVVVLVAAATGPMSSTVTALSADLAGRGATTIVLGGDAVLRATTLLVLPGPDLSELLAPLGLVVPGQLVVEALARRLGLDPDAPRGLSKVTQTDPRAGTLS